MIEVDHVSKHFGAIQAVRDVSFTVGRGEILGFLGPNGAGKTTTMRMLTGVYPPTTGAARVGGLDVFENAIKIRKMIGYLPESVPLYVDMAVRDYLKFVAEIKGVPRSKRVEDIGRAVEACQLQDVRQRDIKKLSKGYRQRVGLAQALIGSPEVLILDEPTIGLDPRQITEIRNVIKSFAGHKTVILSTHILAEVSMTCHRVVIVNKGRVVTEDDLTHLSAQHGMADRVRMRVDGPEEAVRAKLADIKGVAEVAPEGGPGGFIVRAEPDIQPELAKAVIESGWSLREMAPMTVTLEDIFIKLITGDEEAADA